MDKEIKKLSKTKSGFLGYMEHGEDIKELKNLRDKILSSEAKIQD